MHKVKLKERSNSLLNAVMHLWLFHTNYITTGDDAYRLTFNHGRGLGISAFNREGSAMRLLGKITIIQEGKEYTRDEEQQKINQSELHLRISFNMLEETTEEEYNDIESRIPILTDEESILDMSEMTEHSRDNIRSKSVVLKYVDTGGTDRGWISRNNWETKKIFISTTITKRK